MVHQPGDGEIQRSGQQNLPLSYLFPLSDQLRRTVEYRGFQYLFEKLVGKISQTVLRKAFVAPEENLVKDVARVKIRQPEKWQLRQRADTFFGGLPQALLTLGVEPERMHQVGGNQCAFQIVKSCGLTVNIHVEIVLF